MSDAFSLLAHAGHWIGGVTASIVIVAIAIAVWVRERRGHGEREDADLR